MITNETSMSLEEGVEKYLEGDKNANDSNVHPGWKSISEDYSSEGVESKSRKTRESEKLSNNSSRKQDGGEKTYSETDRSDITDSEILEENIQSVEESFSSEDEESSENKDSSDNEESFVEIEFNGNVLNVPIEDLKNTYIEKNKENKQKEDVFILKENIEKEYNSINSKKQELEIFLSQLQSGNIILPPKEIDTSEFQSDPIGYMEKKIKYDEDVKKYQNHLMEMKNKINEISSIQIENSNNFLKNEANTLIKKVPEFKNQEKYKEIISMIKDSSKYYGFDENDINNVHDHRTIMMAIDAAKYRKALKKISSKGEKNVGEKNVIKKGNRRSQETKNQNIRKKFEKLKSTGSINDAVDLYLER